MAENNKNPNKKEEKKGLVVLNYFKKADLKHLIKVFTLLWGLILIVLMTITNVGINQNFDWLAWLSNSLIIFGIMVFGLLMGETSGKDKQMAKEGGLYQSSLSKYEKYNNEITEELVYFNQFYSWLLPQEILTKKIDYLIALGVDPNKAEKIIKYCSAKDLIELKEHAIEVKDDNGKSIIIRQLEAYEVEPVEDVLNGYVKLHAANANYFLTAFADSKVNDRIVEEGKTLQRERRRNRFANRTVKIVSSLTISLVWGLLTVYDFMSGDDMQAWMNLASRITALFTSFFSGWASSVIDIKLQARILENKFKVLQYFHNCLIKKTFIPKTEEELAKQEFEAYLKKKEEEEKKVIQPEVVIEPTDNLLEQKKKEPKLIEKENVIVL